VAVAQVGAASANSTTVALPGGTTAGMLAIVVAGRTNTGGPSIPGLDWVDEGVASGGSGGTAHGSRLGWKILSAADIAAGNVGTWTNASEVGVVVYSGARAFRRNSVAGSGANGTVVTFPAQSGLVADSWQVALGSHRAATAGFKGATMTNYTARTSAATSERIGIFDSNGVTTGIVLRTATVTGSSGNVGWTGEIIASDFAVHGAAYNFNANSPATITDAGGGAVSQWGSNAMPAVLAQGTGANRPTTGIRSLNGRNAIDFDGTNDFLSLDIPDLAQPLSVVAVLQPDNDSSTNGRFYQFENDTEGWGDFFSGDISSSNDRAFEGSYSLKQVANVSTQTAWYTPPGWAFEFGNAAPGATLKILPGTQVTVFGKLYTSTAARFGEVTLTFYQSDGTYISRVVSTPGALTQNAWTDQRVSMVAPSNAACYSFTFRVGSTSGMLAIPLGEVSYLDSVWTTVDESAISGGADIGNFLGTLVGYAGGLSWQDTKAPQDPKAHVVVAIFGSDGTTVGAGRSYGASELGSASQAGGFGSGPMTTIRVGGRDSGTEFWNGAIARFMIYPFALTVAQAATIIAEMVDLYFEPAHGILVPVGAVRRASRW
jgi:hypothetical protein